MTLKETAKSEILEAAAHADVDTFSVKWAHEQLTTGSVDTARAAVAELVEEGKLEKLPDPENSKGFVYQAIGEATLPTPEETTKDPNPAPAATAFELDPDPVTGKKHLVDTTQKGWKMKYLAAAFQVPGTYRRKALAIEIMSDERNTHIMISILIRKGQTPENFTYDRATKSYISGEPETEKEAA